MMGYSHVTIGLAGLVAAEQVFAWPAPLELHTAAQDGTLAILLIAAAFGSLLPDLDTAQSALGRRTKPVSKTIQTVFGHRTLLHSFLGVGLWALLAVAIASAGVSRLSFLPAAHHDYWALIGAIGVGYVLHLLADAVTKDGIPLLWPNMHAFGLPPAKKLRLRTGGPLEHVVVAGVIVLATVIVVSHFHVV